MPLVGKKHYPYTEKGYYDADKARKLAKKKKKKKKRVLAAHGGMVRGPCS